MKTRIGTVITLLTVLATIPVLGQESDVAAELQGVNRTLERLASLLEESLEKQNVELVLKRIELKERRLTPLREELLKAEKELAEYERIMQQMQSELEQHEEILRQATMDVDDVAIQQTRKVIEDLTRYIELQSSDRDARRERKLQLEGELQDGLKDIEDLEDLLDEMLE